MRTTGREVECAVCVCRATPVGQDVVGEITGDGGGEEEREVIPNGRSEAIQRGEIHRAVQVGRAGDREDTELPASRPAQVNDQRPQGVLRIGTVDAEGARRSRRSIELLQKLAR